MNFLKIEFYNDKAALLWSKNLGVTLIIFLTSLNTKKYLAIDGIRAGNIHKT